MLRAMTDRTRRSRPIETCRFCSGALLTSVFDTVFRAPEDEEPALVAWVGEHVLATRKG